MMLDFKVVRVEFNRTSGNVQDVNSFAEFSSDVKNAQVVLNGFNVKFDDSDRPFGQLMITSDNVSWSGKRVNFSTHFLLRDWSGNIDDPYSGVVDFIVIAEVQ